MAKPRSPILGYNHNIRYRGLVFHVQTEDSGISNPHVFTHLFHGGVILSTRKLVYDATSSVDAVKGLMQAQHKAVLRDLKRGLFDDKMDSYLGGTPGLLPRGQGVDGQVDAEMSAGATEPSVGPPPLAEPEVTAPAVALAPTAMPPTPASIAIPTPGRNSGRIAVSQDTLEARAPTERFAADAHGASPLPPPPGGLAQGTDAEGTARQSMTAPTVQTRKRDGEAGRNVSAAFDAIMLDENPGTRPPGGLAEVADDEPAIEIYSPPPPSAAPPPGFIQEPARPGAYAQHRRRESGRFTADGEMLPPSGQAMPPGHAAAAARQAVTRAATTAGMPPAPAPARPGTGPMPRVPTPMTRPQTAPPAPPVRAQPQARTRSPGTGSGGVVVTRPAVIIGAPTRTVGGPTPTSTPSPPPPPAAAARPAPRPRKAREDAESGLFGQDLISEKSLDEVILAYLSEDPADE